MAFIEEYIANIEQLSLDIKQQIANDNYESVISLLEQRLDCLKAFKNQVDAAENHDIATRFYDFLAIVQRQDETVIKQLNVEKAKAFQKTLAQTKNNQAISLYKGVSGS